MGGCSTIELRERNERRAKERRAELEASKQRILERRKSMKISVSKIKSDLQKEEAREAANRGVSDKKAKADREAQEDRDYKKYGREARAWLRNMVPGLIKGYIQQNRSGLLEIGLSQIRTLKQDGDFPTYIPEHVMVRAARRLTGVELVERLILDRGCDSGCSDGCYGHADYMAYYLAWKGQPPSRVDL